LLNIDNTRGIQKAHRLKLDIINFTDTVSLASTICQYSIAQIIIGLLLFV